MPLLALAASVVADYNQHPQAKDFVNKMVDDHGFAREEVVALLAQAEKQPSIIEAISRPAEKTKEWFEYREIFIQESRIAQGVEFWQAHAETLARAEKVFGVAPEIIVAIIGVETRYGRHAGKYRVLDALTTLGFDYPPRGDFFAGQLEQFMLLVREQKQDPLALTGSYAGAMGYGQFIPSSYRSFAVDFDGDKKVDIWHNPVDAIGSVANYFKVHQWQAGKPVFRRARVKAGYDASLLNAKTRPQLTLKDLEQEGFTAIDPSVDKAAKAIPLSYIGDQGQEFWLGFDNFYTITRYNRSHLYARAVWELSEQLRARNLKTPNKST